MLHRRNCILQSNVLHVNEYFKGISIIDNVLKLLQNHAGIKETTMLKIFLYT